MCNNGCVICGGRGIFGECDYHEKCDAKINCSVMERGSRLYVLEIGKACLRDDGELMEAWKQQIIEKDRKIEEMQAHINCLKAELEEIQMNKSELPLEPIEVATMLIKATLTVKANSIQKAFINSDEYDTDRYSNEDLRQIAKHLLVHCNQAEVE